MRLRWPEKVEELPVQGAIIVLTLGGVVLLSAFGRPAAPLAIAGVSILLLLRFGIISNLIVKAFGAEVAITRAEEVTKEAEAATKEAEEAAAKAEAAIQELTMVSLALSTVTIADMALGETGGVVAALNTYKDLTERFTNLDTDVGRAFGDTLKQPIVMKLVMNAFNQLPKQESLIPLWKEVSVLVAKNPVELSNVRTLFEQYGMTEGAETWLSKAEKFQEIGELDLD